MLTDAQLQSYQSDGFVLLKGLIDQASLDRYDKRFLEFVNGTATPPEHMTLMRDVMIAKGVVEPATPAHAINKLLRFEEDPELFGFTQHPALLEAVGDLIGAELYTLVTNVFNKPPGIDGRHPLHQDLRYFQLRPADSIVGVWTAILPATRDSGCLAVIPGSHRGPLLDHKNPDWEYVNFAFYGVDTDAQARVHVEMQPGDTLLFHPLVIHGSGRNTTDGFRRAISTHYASASCEVAEGDWRQGPGVRKVV